MIRLRPAESRDAMGVARLHATSWGTAYRGILSDAYLDGPMPGERQAVWASRLGQDRTPPNLFATVAEDGSQLCGFVCVIAADDPRLGSLIDNLHVLPAYKRHGLGRRLMAAAARSLPEDVRSIPVYLHVFEANRAACAFYERVGGALAETQQLVQPDGSTARIHTYAWASPAALLDGAGS